MEMSYIHNKIGTFHSCSWTQPNNNHRFSGSHQSSVTENPDSQMVNVKAIRVMSRLFRSYAIELPLPIHLFEMSNETSPRLLQ